jgi:hypothetical protein
MRPPNLVFRCIQHLREFLISVKFDAYVRPTEASEHLEQLLGLAFSD